MALPPPTTLVVTSPDGTQIHTQSVGTPAPSKPSILYIHGILSNSLAFDGQFHDPVFRARFFQMRMDLRGMGRSGKPEGAGAYDGRRQAEDVRAVIDAYGVQRPILVGWSYGAIITGDYMEHYPLESIAGIAHICGPMGYPAELAQYFGAPLIAITSLAVQDPAPSFHAFAAELDRYVAALVHKRGAVDDWQMAAFKGFAQGMARAPLTMLLSREMHFDRCKGVASRTLPRFCLAGANDKIMLSTALEHSVATWSPALLTTHLLEDAGHMPHFEEAERFNALLMPWIDKIWTPLL